MFCSASIEQSYYASKNIKIANSSFLFVFVFAEPYILLCQPEKDMFYHVFIKPCTISSFAANCPRPSAEPVINILAMSSNLWLIHYTATINEPGQVIYRTEALPGWLLNSMVCYSSRQRTVLSDCQEVLLKTNHRRKRN